MGNKIKFGSVAGTQTITSTTYPEGLVGQSVRRPYLYLRDEVERLFPIDPQLKQENSMDKDIMESRIVLQQKLL